MPCSQSEGNVPQPYSSTHSGECLASLFMTCSTFSMGIVIG